MNWHIHEQLRRHFDLIAPGPITPRVSARAKLISRVQRYLLKWPSNFFFFSPVTLDDNAARASAHFRGDIDAVFFRSAASWCHCVPPVPYFVYLDAVFHTFFENTFRQKDFRAADLQRIYESEAEFLENAAAVFFESDWGLQKAREAYDLGGRHYHVTGRGGVLNPPDKDEWKAEPLYLLSIAMNFEQKGGDIILQAFRQLRGQYPDLRWHVIGGRPTSDWQSVDGLVYEGVLDPAKESDTARFRRLLAQAFLLVHPTREDTNPLVLTEAAYFGCPAISINRFAIPELVLDGRTGILLNAPVQPADLASAIQSLIASPDTYREMRRAAFAHSRSKSVWDEIGRQIAGTIETALQKRGTD